MSSKRSRPIAALLVVAVWCVGFGGESSVHAAPRKTPKDFSGLIPSGLSDLHSSDANGPALSIEAAVDLNPAGTIGRLQVRVAPEKGWHIFSVTQKEGGPLRTSIKLEPSAAFELAGPFQPDTRPTIEKSDVFDVPVEEHHGAVTWSAPLRIAPDTDLQQLQISGKVLGQICKDSGGACVPLSQLGTQFTASVRETRVELPPLPAEEPPGATNGNGDADKRRTPPVQEEVAQAKAAPKDAGPLVPDNVSFKPTPAEGFRNGPVHAALQGELNPAVGAAGLELTLTITATPLEGWHIYAYAPHDPKLISKPTLIAVSDPPLWKVGEVKASEEPTVKESGIPIEPKQHYHERTVSWQVPITIPAGTAAGEYAVKGMIGYQTCSDTGCDQPTGAYFLAKVRVGEGDGKANSVPLQFASGKYALVAKYLDPGKGSKQGAAVPPVIPTPGSVDGPGPSGPIQFDIGRIVVDETSRMTTGYILMVALVVSFILNFMPCVLPVIGLKIISFVQQAGASRSRVFLLNLVYSLGMLTVFWLLAGLAVIFGLGWGEQFNSAPFAITMLCIVFVMGLSFIGVWEIPIPGFVGGSKLGDLAHHEGLGGAFFKGIVTTILATPCSGPGVATALTWATGKPTSLVYLVFTCMGLGMAIPYLLIGMFPRLIRFLPKPGAWMETFKQFMGFVLMGTVVYMFTLLKQDYVVPTLALIFSLWAACWWIGRVPFGASVRTKAWAWLTAGATAAAISWFAFSMRHAPVHELPWEPFSLAALDEHIKQHRTVMVDFTAVWCPTCKLLERRVLNTQSIRSVVDRNEVITLVADWSDENDDIEKMLKALGSKQIPVLAIFPAGDPYRPKKLSGFYSRSDVVAKLEEAGPSQPARLVIRN